MFEIKEHSSRDRKTGKIRLRQRYVSPWENHSQMQARNPSKVSCKFKISGENYAKKTQVTFSASRIYNFGEEFLSTEDIQRRFYETPVFSDLFDRCRQPDGSSSR
jgi:hypothetical protein